MEIKNKSPTFEHLTRAKIETLSITSRSNTIAPRIGFGWHPKGDSRLSFRGGYGMYYTQIRTNALAGYLVNGLDGLTTYTADGLLSKNEAGDWSTSKAAIIDGYVIQLEREADGDHHLMLATNAGETSTTKWVIVEVTPTWGKQLASLSAGQLNNLRGKHIRVTGWLYYEPQSPSRDPRGTRWEIHPVTNITILN